MGQSAGRSQDGDERVDQLEADHHAKQETEIGIAGARVDRIAAAARVNKQLIYAYFGSKEQFFDAVLARNCRPLFEEVPFDPDDLPGYFGRLFGPKGTPSTSAPRGA
jgi:AcrR family transcriptional regulator